MAAVEGMTISRTILTLGLRKTSQVVGEYNGSTGAVLVLYGYAGGRMIWMTECKITVILHSSKRGRRLDSFGKSLG